MKTPTFTCGLDAAIAVMGGKWKGLILFALQDGPLRFGELRRAVAGISERVLILQLREMEATGLLHREVYHQVPPKVEYSLTGFGRSLNSALAPLGEWGEAHLDRIEAIPWDQVR
ncbi:MULTISPECIES: winged helix-turn-helix transcriptional regulator [Amycolatopsis]|uniref:Helix-turn-helix transcriptional regulator n=1 Tax=Amycolatopsis thermalba TaxID=944492 RepID=A0ABY4NUK5_9PSEU|nr:MULTISPECIES: helix-turn-helix domain-containing protein [Amycolatopsis]OXM72951.1 transcriptional regulator [Amycolatopsis sp. KNN50.9b]UQS23747.1 helix-turn-helix transcriptional regulator [Amycolatopsis thermalba]